MKDLDTKECAKWANDAINLCYTADEVEEMVKTRLGLSLD
jgi:phosphotransferase system enzyme I (PtsI)